MYPGIHDVVRGCRMQEQRFDVIANNLANARTTGFKKDVLSFGQMLETHQQVDMRQGNIMHTGNTLDVALAGEGCFKVSTAEGMRYTRNGRFYINSESLLATAEGDPVLGEGGPITIEGKEVTINEAGQIAVDGEEVDTLAVVSFTDQTLLMKQGFSYYVYNGKEGEGPRPEETLVKQQYLEQSNVVVTEEVVRMVDTLRKFESYQKVLRTFDETDAKAINEVGKL